MDVCGPVIRLGIWPEIAPHNWRRQDWGEGRVTWLHRPTSMVFQVYLEDGPESEVARLIHVCDGKNMPSLEAQQWFGCAAILQESCLNGHVFPILVRHVAEDQDGPPAPLTPEEEAVYDEIARELWEMERPATSP